MIDGLFDIRITAKILIRFDNKFMEAAMRITMIKNGYTMIRSNKVGIIGETSQPTSKAGLCKSVIFYMLLSRN